MKSPLRINTYGMGFTSLVVGLVFMLYVYLMQFVDHTSRWIPVLVVFLSLSKVVFFTLYSFGQIKEWIDHNHSVSSLVRIFGLAIFLMIFSFASDYVCLAGFDKSAFIFGKEPSIWIQLYEAFYFSMVTFASIGYGDTVPVTILAKALVMIEITQSFLLIVFGLSNINNIRLQKGPGKKS
ncbi:MAG: two pore domain potassium channel family protein [Cyclobacteriaceae bacterium]|nr:two pore domain potassium channel family protein [Cyclobacteriaceae bacterium SS2]